MGQCAIPGCATPAKPNQLMCWPHWRRVPRALNHAVFDTFRNLRADPGAYRQARDAAVAAVVEKERVELEASLPDGLFLRDGRVMFDCRTCGEATEWQDDPANFDKDNPANVCGGSPRCCP